ncbi:MAG: hypothetical protein F4201_00060 [Nitrospira sp. SB0677_bin_15]|nr:hypothetical protein [Nitrospira sp. SB0677_bin_15]MYH01209.1 hypothetical protein [Nitrospira sp. SB0675_bin_23]
MNGHPDTRIITSTPRVTTLMGVPGLGIVERGFFELISIILCSGQKRPIGKDVIQSQVRTGTQG